MKYLSALLGFCKNTFLSLLEFVKNLFLKLLDFVNLLDTNKNLSLSNIGVTIILYKLAMAEMAEVSWEMLITSGIIFINYLGKRAMTHSAMLQLKKMGIDVENSGSNGTSEPTGGETPTSVVVETLPENTSTEETK